MSPSLPSSSTSDGEKILSSPATTASNVPSSSTSDGEKILSSPATTVSNEEKIITTSPNVTLKTSNGETFEVAINVISQSQTIKHMIEDGCANEFIPIPNVDGKILSKVIEYCKKHHKSSDEILDEKKQEQEDKIRQWDIEFMINMEDSEAVELILVANYLDIKGLLDLIAQKIADDIKDYPLERVRKMFNIKKDFEAGEIEKLKKQYGDAGWTEE